MKDDDEAKRLRWAKSVEAWLHALGSEHVPAPKHWTEYDPDDYPDIDELPEIPNETYADMPRVRFLCPPEDPPGKRNGGGHWIVTVTADAQNRGYLKPVQMPPRGKRLSTTPPGSVTMKDASWQSADAAELYADEPGVIHPGSDPAIVLQKLQDHLEASAYHAQGGWLRLQLDCPECIYDGRKKAPKLFMRYVAALYLHREDIHLDS